VGTATPTTAMAIARAAQKAAAVRAASTPRPLTTKPTIPAGVLAVHAADAGPAGTLRTTAPLVARAARTVSASHRVAQAYRPWSHGSDTGRLSLAAGFARGGRRGWEALSGRRRTAPSPQGSGLGVDFGIRL
jgi:hypothetical protein